MAKKEEERQKSDALPNTHPEVLNLPPAHRSRNVIHHPHTDHIGVSTVPSTRMRVLEVRRVSTQCRRLDLDIHAIVSGRRQRMSRMRKMGRVI